MAKKKKKTPAWQDSVYRKQLSYYKKLAADFAAQEARRRAEVGTYYGTLGTADTKTPVKDKKGKQVYKTTKVRGNERKPVRIRVWDPRAKRWNVYNTSVPVIKTKKEPKYNVKKGQAATEGLYQKELAAQRVKDLSDISSDYGARGIIHSGLFAQKRGDYESEYGKQLAEINRQRSKQYADLSAEKLAFQREQELQKENARLDAIRRRAAQTGSLLGF